MTQLLQEMIELREDRMLLEAVETLLEYLGNLAVIDRGLIRSLKKLPTYFFTDKKRSAEKLDPALGQKSKVEKKVATGKNSDQLWKTYDEDSSIVAMVIEVGGEQIAVLTDKSRSDPEGNRERKPGEGMYFIMADNFLSALGMSEKDFDETFMTAVEKRNAYRLVNGSKARTLKAGTAIAKGFVRKLLDVVMKRMAAGANDKVEDGEDRKKAVVNVLYIHKDEEKKKLQHDRSNARFGRVPTPADDKTRVGRRGEGFYTEYIKNLKRALDARLDKFKAAKAKQFATADELVKFIRDEGYLDKVKVGEYNYKMYDSRVYFDQLLKDARGKPLDGWHNESYVEYRIEGASQYQLRKEAAKKLKAENPDMTDEEAFDKSLELTPPGALKVMLKMNKGVIEPTEVKIDKNMYSF